MVGSSVVGISPYYRGRNGSLPSIRRKGRFLCVENVERKTKMKLGRKKSKEENASANNGWGSTSNNL